MGKAWNWQIRPYKAICKRKWSNEYKATLFCQNCGANHPAIIQFHHRDKSKKKYDIGYMIGQTHAVESILKEIEKCDACCANCHMKLHYKNTFKYRGISKWLYEYKKTLRCV